MLCCQLLSLIQTTMYPSINGVCGSTLWSYQHHGGIDCLYSIYRPGKVFIYMSRTFWKVHNINSVSLSTRFSLNKKARGAFGRFQISGTSTQQLHALDHFCKDATQVDEAENLHAGVHEESHKQLKIPY